MLNFIWPIFLIASFIYAICFGNIAETNTAIFTSTEEAVNLCIKLLGTICLWNGIMKVAQGTKIIKTLKKLLRPFLKILFPKINEDEEVYSEISMNMIANIMGLGNAATPMGLKTMKSLQKKNTDKNKLSDEMAIFIVLNTASIQIIPTTVIAIRNSLNSNNPTAILFPVWIATLCAAISAISVARILIKRR
ncbi:MAG: hypothetical protein IKJ72_03390 [Mycoplasmataceae bacterium]|nr:hypothetical protein [Mycoplasmataceae bacterium]